jgi:hypothetical protein
MNLNTLLALPIEIDEILKIRLSKLSIEAKDLI